MTTTTQTLAPDAIVRAPENLWKQAQRAFFRQRSAVIGLVIVRASPLQMRQLFQKVVVAVDAPYKKDQWLLFWFLIWQGMNVRFQNCFRVLRVMITRRSHCERL